MAEAYVSPDGVVTIPEQFRIALGLAQGGRIEFVQLKEGTLTMVALTLRAEELRGVIVNPKRSYSSEQMNEIVAKAVAKAAK